MTSDTDEDMAQTASTRAEWLSTVVVLVAVVPWVVAVTLMHTGKFDIVVEWPWWGAWTALMFAGAIYALGRGPVNHGARLLSQLRQRDGTQSNDDA